MTIFLTALGSSRRPPLPPAPTPSNTVAKKKAVISTRLKKFNFVWGGTGEVATFTNIAEKVPTLLTSTVGQISQG